MATVASLEDPMDSRRRRRAAGRRTDSGSIWNSHSVPSKSEKRTRCRDAEATRIALTALRTSAADIASRDGRGLQVAGRQASRGNSKTAAPDVDTIEAVEDVVRPAEYIPARDDPSHRAHPGSPLGSGHGD